MIKYYLLYDDEAQTCAEEIAAGLTDSGLVNASDECDDDGAALLGADFLFMVVSDAAQIEKPEIRNRWEAFDNEIRWKRKPLGEILFFVPDDGVLKNLPLRLKKYGYYLFDEVSDAAGYCEETMRNAQNKKRVSESEPSIKQIKYSPSRETVEQIKYNPTRETVEQIEYNPEKDSIKQIKYNPERKSVNLLNKDSAKSVSEKHASGEDTVTPDEVVEKTAESLAQSIKSDVTPKIEADNEHEYRMNKYDYIFEELKRADKKLRENNPKVNSKGCIAAIAIFVVFCVISVIVAVIVNTLRMQYAGFAVSMSEIAPLFDFAPDYVCPINALQ